jgi:hypothetical protein
MSDIPVWFKLCPSSTNEHEENQMNSKNLQYSVAGNSKLETFISQQVSLLTTITSKAFSFIIRSEIEKSQAKYKMKRQQRAQAQLHQDIVNTLPVETKLGLGMYHFMD